jgi:hypothetical protein
MRKAKIPPELYQQIVKDPRSARQIATELGISCHKTILRIWAKYGRFPPARASFSNEYVDGILREERRPIIRVGNIIDSKTPIEFACTIIDCQYHWNTMPIIVVGRRKSGCPKCYGNVKITDEDIDRALKEQNKPIIRISTSNGTHSCVIWECIKEHCRKQWKTSPNSILIRGTGCPFCAGVVKLTDADIDCRLKEQNRPIIRVSERSDRRHLITWGCLNELCLRQWEASLGSVLNNGSGCPYCCMSKNEKLVGKILAQTNLIIEPQMRISKITDYGNTKISVDFYLPQIKTVIEYNGRQHYEPRRFGGMSVEEAQITLSKQQERDLLVEQICKTNGITLIWIDGRKYKSAKLERYLREEIIPLLTKSE